MVCFQKLNRICRVNAHLITQKHYSSSIILERYITLPLILFLRYTDMALCIFFISGIYLMIATTGLSKGFLTKSLDQRDCKETQLKVLDQSDSLRYRCVGLDSAITNGYYTLSSAMLIISDTFYKPIIFKLFSLSQAKQ